MTDLLMEFISPDSNCWKLALSQNTASDLMTLSPRKPMIRFSDVNSVLCYIQCGIHLLCGSLSQGLDYGVSLNKKIKDVFIKSFIRRFLKKPVA